MKIRAETNPDVLSAELQECLATLRTERGFDVEDYIRDKVALIDEYFRTYSLKAAVVGVSGGIDSSVVLGVLSRCQSIEHIVPVLLPAYDNDGVQNQEEATRLGKEICAYFDLVPSVVEVGTIFKEAEPRIFQSLNNHLSKSGNEPAQGSPWARGQLIPYLRTPILYYHTTLLADSNTPAVIVGTTNFSEGGYLGYIGKASDGMVDLQIIADIYKSEVYQVAEYLGLPESIVTRKPTGDMFEDIGDEEVFGATYDFVELFMESKGIHDTDAKIAEFLSTLSDEARNEYNKYAESLEAMHRYNKHKYLGASPAVHLDTLETKLSTWTKNTWNKNRKEG